MRAFAIVWAGQLVSLLGSAIPIGYAAAPGLAHVLTLPALVIVMGIVTWLAAIATFAFTPYRELDRLCWDGAR